MMQTIIIMLSENSVKFIFIIMFLLFAYFMIGDYTPCYVKCKQTNMNNYHIPYIETENSEQMIYHLD